MPREKLYDYVLAPDHPEGRNKARVFKSMLGIERGHADVLSTILKASLSRAAAKEGSKDEHGQRWTTYHDIVGLNGKSAIVTVGWIFEAADPERPRLVTCYIETENQANLEQLLRSR